MKKTLFLLLALLIVGSGFAQKAPQTKLVTSTEDRIVVNFQLNGFSTARVATPQGDQFIVNVPRMASMLEAGAPDLPMYPIPAVIGDRAEMTVNVIDAQYTDYPNTSIAPSKGNLSRQVNPNDVPYTYGAMYQQDAFWPATPAYLEKPYILRDFRGQNIMVRPFAYNPVTKTLRVYESLTLEMTKVSDNGENQKVTRRDNTIKVSPEQKAQYNRRFINFGQATAKYPFDEDLGEMLIICTDAYMSNLQPLADWKNQSGRPTTLVSLTTAGGNNANNIKNYISNIYNDPNHNLEFILLVGEYNDLTPYVIDYEKKSDNWFGKMEGNDNYLELLVGRLSVSNAADADLQVNKIIHYERDITVDDTWCNKGLGIGSIYEGAGGHFGEYDNVHIDHIRDTLLHYTYNTVTDLHSGQGASIGSISGAINEGVSIINYCNHGSTTSWGVANYSNSDVAELTNNDKLPFVWSVACLNGQFDTGTCFAEAWMRAGNGGNMTGAIGGMFSWISQPWQPPMYGQDEMVDILTEWHSADLYYHTLGGASLNGSMYVLDAAPNDDNETFNTWLLFGDPSLLVRTDNPTEMGLNLTPAALMVGMSSLELTAETNYGIATLSNSEGVIATATIVNGTAVLEFPALDAVEDLSLTVIGYNKVTEVMPVSVLPAEGAYISVDAFTPGNVPVNEEQLMSMTFKNIGVDATAGTTTVVLSCDDERLTFSDNTATFESLGANETVTLTDEFAFTVAPGVEDNTKIQIDINMTCNGSIWTGKAKITVGAPIIAFDEFQCIGGYTPGESQNVIVRFRNDGHYKATNAVVSISCQDESGLITFDNNTVEIGTVEVGSICTAMFTVNIDSTYQTDQVINLLFNFTADNDVMAEGTGDLKNTCNVVFALSDSYGDGWNGNNLVVNFNDGTPSQNLTFTEGSSANFTLEIGIGTHVTLGWIAGSYPHECGFTVSYLDGDEITSVASTSWGNSPLNASWSYEFDVYCGGMPVVGVLTPVDRLQYTVDEENRALVLRWRAPEDALSYIITRDGIEIGQTSENTFIDEDPIESTEYCVIARYMAGDAEATCTEVGEVWGVEEERDEVNLYPNPVNGTLYLNGGDTEYSYVLYNGMGQTVASGTAKGMQTIDCSNMAKGVYFMHLTVNAKVSVEKVVVK